jgi:hypothetical protein
MKATKYEYLARERDTNTENNGDRNREEQVTEAERQGDREI